MVREARAGDGGMPGWPASASAERHWGQRWRTRRGGSTMGVVVVGVRESKGGPVPGRGRLPPRAAIPGAAVTALVDAISIPFTVVLLPVPVATLVVTRTAPLDRSQLSPSTSFVASGTTPSASPLPPGGLLTGANAPASLRPFPSLQDLQRLLSTSLSAREGWPITLALHVGVPIEAMS